MSRTSDPLGALAPPQENPMQALLLFSAVDYIMG